MANKQKTQASYVGVEEDEIDLVALAKTIWVSYSSKYS